MRTLSFSVTLSLTLACAVTPNDGDPFDSPNNGSSTGSASSETDNGSSETIAPPPDDESSDSNGDPSDSSSSGPGEEKPEFYLLTLSTNQEDANFRIEEYPTFDQDGNFVPPIDPFSWSAQYCDEVVEDSAWHCEFDLPAGRIYFVEFGNVPPLDKPHTEGVWLVENTLRICNYN